MGSISFQPRITFSILKYTEHLSNREWALAKSTRKINMTENTWDYDGIWHINKNSIGGSAFVSIQHNLEVVYKQWLKMSRNMKQIRDVCNGIWEDPTI